MKNILFLLFVLSSTFVFSQEKKPIEKEKIEFGGLYKNTISINGGGTSAVAGISFEHFLTKNLMLDVGLGYLGGGLGFRIYPWAVKRKTFRPHITLTSTYFIWPDAAQFQSNYIGLGATYFAVYKFNIGLDFGASYFYHYASSPKSFPDTWFIMGNLKIGYRFSFYAMKRRKKYFNHLDDE